MDKDDLRNILYRQNFNYLFVDDCDVAEVNELLRKIEHRITSSLRNSVIAEVSCGYERTFFYQRDPYTVVGITYRGVMGIGVARRCKTDRWDTTFGSEVATKRAIKAVAEAICYPNEDHGELQVGHDCDGNGCSCSDE